MEDKPTTPTQSEASKLWQMFDELVFAAASPEVIAVIESGLKSTHPDLNDAAIHQLSIVLLKEGYKAVMAAAIQVESRKQLNQACKSVNLPIS